MSATWYPQKEEELNNLLESFFVKTPQLKQKVHGVIVPHAAYQYSGKIAGDAFSFLKKSQFKKAIILSPSHYLSLTGVCTHNADFWKTPLGKIKISGSDFPKTDISKEHAIDNQIPFLQKLGFTEILPLLVGELTKIDAKKAAEEISGLDGAIIISTDLSHFLHYRAAAKKDAETITSIEDLNSDALIKNENSACGIFPLMVLIELCKIKKWKPQVIEYKNSGDMIGDGESVVGYAGMIF